MPDPIETAIVQTPFGEMECPADDGFLPHLREFGTHQRSDTALLQRLLLPNDVALDVGAFIGTMAVPLARVVGPGGRIVCFEPHAAHVAVLGRNIERNGLSDRVEIVQALVGKTDGGAYVSDRLDISAATTFYLASDEVGGGTTPAITLDGWLSQQDSPRRVRMLKIDVEGWEVDALRGAEHLMMAHRPVVALEVASYQLRRTGDTLASLQEHLDARAYRCLINIAPRDSRSDDYWLAELPDLGVLGSSLRDIIAVPEELDVELPIGPAHLVAEALRLQKGGGPRRTARSAAWGRLRTGWRDLRRHGSR